MRHCLSLLPHSYSIISSTLLLLISFCMPPLVTIQKVAPRKTCFATALLWWQVGKPLPVFTEVPPWLKFDSCIQLEHNLRNFCINCFIFSNYGTGFFYSIPCKFLLKKFTGFSSLDQTITLFYHVFFCYLHQASSNLPFFSAKVLS